MDKFKHDVEEVLHEVEEVLHDVKEHMILSVRDYSLQIAFFLMAVTSAILVIGTVYVWCFHHPKNPHAEVERVKRSSMTDQQSEVTDQQSDNGDKENRFSREDSMDSDAGKGEQNGQVRRRTTSSSGTNNNNSPVKSKIPVRMKSKTS